MDAEQVRVVGERGREGRRRPVQLRVPEVEDTTRAGNQFTERLTYVAFPVQVPSAPETATTCALPIGKVGPIWSVGVAGVPQAGRR